MAHFKGSDKRSLGTLDDLSALEETIRAGLESPNIIYAVRLEGDFDRVDARSEHPQPEGHRPFNKTIALVQTTFAFENRQGTLVGFWFPEHMKAINVSGFHFHFLDAEHAVGGHVFDLRLRAGTLQVMPIFDFGMHLLHTPLFEQVDLSREDEAATRAVEKAPDQTPTG